MSSYSLCISLVVCVIITMWILFRMMGTSLNGYLMRTTPHITYGDWLRQCAPPPPIKPIDVYVFIHVCNVGRWQSILCELMDRMRESGLYDACAGLFYGCSCPDCETIVTHQMNTTYTKAVALPTVPAPNHTHENWTINAAILFARAHIGCHMLYIHTKGVTNVSKSLRYWRHWMTDYTISLWPVCVRLLASGYHRQRTVHNRHRSLNAPLV
jgi:hypothetical protein